MHQKTSTWNKYTEGFPDDHLNAKKERERERMGVSYEKQLFPHFNPQSSKVLDTFLKSSTKAMVE